MTLFWLWYVIILPVIIINNIEDCFIFTLCINKANKQITKCLCRKAKWLLKTLTILSYLLCVCKDQISKAQEQTYCVVRKSRRPAPFWMTQCHRNASKYFVVHHGSKNPIKASKITVHMYFAQPDLKFFHCPCELFLYLYCVLITGQKCNLRPVHMKRHRIASKYWVFKNICQK